MKIIIPGILRFAKETKQFTCKKCGCVFEADRDEYSCGTQYNDGYYMCQCPTCGNIAYLDE